MAVQVQVKNFQSIEEADISIDGLTVVTGANHSGKTAIMRAIKGVFTNAPPGPLVRHGCAYLSVRLTFDDGTCVLWEKGWEKPEGKGKTVNRYTINGKQIAGVGRGVPPEVESLGVREISAASDRVWPQIAQQFDGTLFLVNRPGSAIAEALSDVERVGKLSSALKASEKDRRSANAELKVRRKDVDTHKQTAQRFEGLAFVAGQVHSLASLLDALREDERLIQEGSRLLTRLDTATQASKALSGFEAVVIPDTKALKIQQAIGKITQYSNRLQQARATQERLAGFAEITLPDDTTAAEKKRLHAEALVFQRRHKAALGEVNTLVDTATEVSAQLAEAEAEVKRLLGDRGECPTCNTVHEGTHP